MKIELTNLKHEQQNIGKRIKATKKQYVWEFLAKFSRRSSDKGDINLLYRVELKDSSHSGKKTIIINGQEIVSDTKIENFATLPYMIQKDPIVLKIMRSKKGNLVYDLLIDDFAFSMLRQQGILFQYKKNNEKDEPWFSEGQPLSNLQEKDEPQNRTTRGGSESNNNDLVKCDYQPFEQFVLKEEEQLNHYNEDHAQQSSTSSEGGLKETPNPTPQEDNFFQFDTNGDGNCLFNRQTTLDNRPQTTFIDEFLMAGQTNTPSKGDGFDQKSFFDFNSTSVQSQQNHNSGQKQPLRPPPMHQKSHSTVEDRHPLDAQQFQSYQPQPFVQYAPVYNPYYQTNYGQQIPPPPMYAAYQTNLSGGALQQQQQDYNQMMNYTNNNRDFHVQQMLKEFNTGRTSNTSLNQQSTISLNTNTPSHYQQPMQNTPAQPPIQANDAYMTNIRNQQMYKKESNMKIDQTIGTLFNLQ